MSVIIFNTVACLVCKARSKVVHRYPKTLGSTYITAQLSLQNTSRYWQITYDESLLILDLDLISMIRMHYLIGQVILKMQCLTERRGAMSLSSNPRWAPGTLVSEPEEVVVKD